MTTRKTLKKLVKNYSLILTNLGFKLNPNFEKDFLHIKRMKTNSTKISFIKKDKIEGLEKNVPDFILKPNDTKQREKYFTAVKPSKFLQSMVLSDNSKEVLFSQISEQFNKDFVTNIKSKLKVYSGDDISKIYNSASVVGCMAKKCKSWFKVYADTENLQLATLEDDDTILIRSLLWYDKEVNNYWLCNSYEQPAINGDNEIRKEYQKNLIYQVLKYITLKEGETKTSKQTDGFFSFGFGCKFADSLSSSVIEEIESNFNTKIFKGVKHTDSEETEISKNKIMLKPKIKDFDRDNYEAFPFSDTFQSIGNSGRWYIDNNEGDTRFIMLTSQNGEDDNNNIRLCDSCGERYDEEEVYYSDYEDEYLCDECSVYIDERDTSVRRDNATYNDYANTYHLTDDLRQC